jgi:hypothetical protein
VDKFYIYFFPERGKESPAIKIGYSKHPVKRLKQLQTGHPTKIGSEGWIEVGTEKDAQQIESAYHVMFKKQRIRDNGEWFTYSDGIKDFISKLMKDKLFTRYFE